ncbi:glycosyl transferase [Xenorhabdus khoisanae]|uniref:Glycosyl transferase n=1 Tax=Xenorhabdus khoisanae TaxID=880157 RepID=A0A0J5IKF6_9GAMM|nr:glycosyltransferase [Xenorhabdus khoisanae]KMJ43650.1 glycosyl transferase [Xenorhabdus khoisanae]
MNFSVLMAVYIADDAHYLHQAIESIWDFQSIKPAQVVLVQDGPLKPEHYNVIEQWKHRLGDILTIIPLSENVGLGIALNEGLLNCKYELVARMDSDDIALADRFKIQIPYMLQNTDIAASSGFVEEWDEKMSTLLGTRHVPTHHDSIVKMAKFRSPLSHPAAIFRRDIVLNLGGYPGLRKAQDFALWSLLIKKSYKLSNVPDVLLKMRTGNSLISRRGIRHFKYEVELLKFQRSIGFLSFTKYCINIVLKGGLRLSPVFFKKIAYKVLR